MKVKNITKSENLTKGDATGSTGNNFVVARRVSESSTEEVCELHSRGVQEQVDPYLDTKRTKQTPYNW